MTKIVQEISSNLQEGNNILKPLEGHFKVSYCKVFKYIHISPWIGPLELLTHTNFF